MPELLSTEPPAASPPAHPSAPDLPTAYDPHLVEPAMRARWDQSRCFVADPAANDAEAYSIVIPPPNVTGALHMGHALNNTVQDILIRHYRMRGRRTAWIPGTDHAGIATQAVVERLMFEQEGKTRHDIGREALVQRIWDWKEKYGERIINQLKALGCSCDWTRTRFTMDEQCSYAVREAFFRLFRDGLIYRGQRLVNWDCHLQTAVANDEIEQVEQQGNFWYIRYPLVNESLAGKFPPYVTIATTRPETLLGDTAVAVCPDPGVVFERELAKLRELGDTAAIDRLEQRRALLPLLEHYARLARGGARLTLPLVGREIPLITDEHADPLKGTGAVKITPAHDPNDYDVWQRHKQIGAVNILNENGTINAEGEGTFREESFSYVGLDRFVARKKIVADLERLELLDKIEQISNTVPVSDRSKTIIEPYLSEQWFVRMGGGLQTHGRTGEMSGLAQMAMDAVSHGSVTFIPDRYARTYLDWLGEKIDWCISRQLWWGHRIPVWSHDFGTPAGVQMQLRKLAEDQRLTFQEAVGTKRQTLVCPAADATEVVQLLEEHGFVRDPDVLDTWFSSALWPLSTLGWPQRTADLQTWYPTSVLVTSRDIITLWVARMVLFGRYLDGRVPFHQVHINAKVLDGDGVTMSKSKGNGIDPLDLIQRFGTDGLRYTLAEMLTGLQDIRLPVQVICPHCGHQFPNPKGTKQVVGCPSCKQPMTRPMGIASGSKDAPLASITSDKFEVGRNFSNKLWNAGRFVLMALAGKAFESSLPTPVLLEDRWILSRLQHAVTRVTEAIEQYEFAAAVDAFRSFFWGEFCDWYLELAKPRLADDTLSDARPILAYVLDQSLRLLHPVCPFITEDLFGRLQQCMGMQSSLLATAAWPVRREALVDSDAEREIGLAVELTREVRRVRASQNIAPSKLLDVVFVAGVEALHAGTRETLTRFVRELGPANEVSVEPGRSKSADSAAGVAGGLSFHVLGAVDLAAERQRLGKQQAELTGRIANLRDRLSKPSYTDKAPPHLVQQTRDQLAAAEAELSEVEGSLATLP